MKAMQYFIYLFRVKATGDVIYVGSCRKLAERLNEHRRAFREPKHQLPIHKYMIENNLELFKDVEVALVWYSSNVSKEDALKVEEEYFYKYQATVKNTRPAEIRSGVWATRNKPVKCLNDGKVFLSIRQAAEYYGIDRTTIMYHLNKGRKILRGYAFEYVNADDVVERPQMWTMRCVEDNKYFQTISQCAAYYGIKKDTFYQQSSHNRGEKRFTYHGKTFERCND